jgi:hypothetical protein
MRDSRLAVGIYNLFLNRNRRQKMGARLLYMFLVILPLLLALAELARTLP